MFPEIETRLIARVTAALMLVALLAACAGALRWDGDSGADTYTVKEGDTLYSIAFRHGLDYRELAKWNEIGSGFMIYPGDELILSAGASRSASSRTAARETGGKRRTRDDQQAASSRGSQEGTRPSRSASAPQRRSDLSWVWPLQGELLSAFGDGAMGRGIQIGADEGAIVKAAAPGRVVYTGSGLIGYGQLIIIKHDDVFLSAYGHNREILVDEGDEVKAGDRIARVGLGRGNRSMLHFEIRSEGNAVDPVPYLPGRG